MTSPRRPEPTDPEIVPIGRRPDSTDPDLRPIGAPAETGHLPAYTDPPELADSDEQPEDGDEVEDGLRGDGGAGNAVVERLTRRPRDMALSIGVVLIVVLGLFGLYKVLGGDRVDVDPGPAFADARAAAAFPVLEPKGLPEGWTPVSASYQPQDAGAVLRVGYETPSDGSVQLVQGNLSPDVLLDNELGAGADEEGELDINGKTWKVYAAREGERALVLLEPGRTVIVVGRADDAELKELATALG